MGEAVAFYTTEHRSIAAPIIRARVVELVDTRDLKSRGFGRVRAGSSPAPGTKFNHLAPVLLRSLSSVCALIVPILCPNA